MATESTVNSASFHLTEAGEVVTWPDNEWYVFVERIGPFAQTAREAWTHLHHLRPEVEQHNTVTKYAALYQHKAEVYRAVLFLAAEPKQLPAGLQRSQHSGGRFARFVMTGDFVHLPAASGRVWQIVEERPIALRSSAFTIENYLDNPATTPAEKMRTEILVPTAL